MSLGDYWNAAKDALREGRLSAFMENLQESEYVNVFWSDRRKYDIEHSEKYEASVAKQERAWLMDHKNPKDRQDSKSEIQRTIEQGRQMREEERPREEKQKDRSDGWER